MLRSLHDLAKYQVSASDGDIGTVSDFLFDEKTWKVRSLVVDTGSFWRGPHRVLVAPTALQKADWSTRRFHLALTQAVIRESPSVDVEVPTSGPYEQACFSYCGWPCWGIEAYAATVAGKPQSRARPEAASSDPHLRSTQEIIHYRVHGNTADLGRIVDFIVDDKTWKVCYLVIVTSGRWFGEKVLVELRWAPELRGSERRVYLRRPRATPRVASPRSLRQPPPLRQYRAGASARDSADRSRAAETR